MRQVVFSCESGLFDYTELLTPCLFVFGESSAYTGYHVMYYVGEGELYSSYLAKTDMQNEALTEWSEDLFANYEATEGSGMRFVGK